MRLDLHEFRKVNVARCNEVFDSLESWSPQDWACAAAGEMGELCNLIKKMRRGESVPSQDLADELADVVCYVDLLAARLGIDLCAAIIHKFDEVSRKRGAKIFLSDHLVARAMARAGMETR
jgi:NTP pyrophosphatase (non-canonical NTP hydrolase)